MKNQLSNWGTVIEELLIHSFETVLKVRVKHPELFNPSRTHPPSRLVFEFITCPFYSSITKCGRFSKSENLLDFKNYSLKKTKENLSLSSSIFF